MAPNVTFPRTFNLSALEDDDSSTSPMDNLHSIFSLAFKLPKNAPWANSTDSRFLNLQSCINVASDSELFKRAERCKSEEDWAQLLGWLPEQYPKKFPMPQTPIQRYPSTIYDVIAGVKRTLDTVQSELQLWAHEDQPMKFPTATNSIFLDGLGDMYGADSTFRGRVEDLFSETDAYGRPRLLFNTSGSGKTILLTEGLCKNIGFYFVAKDASESRASAAPLAESLGSIDLLMAWQFLKDSRDFYSHGANNDTPEGRATTNERNSNLAKHVYEALLLSRALVLKRFLELARASDDAIEFPDICRRWTHLQLLPSTLQIKSKEIFAVILDLVLQCPDLADIRRERENVFAAINDITEKPIWLVADEAQNASTAFPEAFYKEEDPKAKEAHKKEHARSSLLKLVNVFASSRTPTRSIVSATGLSISSIPNDRASAVAKVRPDIVVWNNTGGFDAQATQTAYLKKKLEPGQSLPCACDLYDLAWEWLRGRYRFIATFAALVLRFGNDRARPLLRALVIQLTNGFVPSNIPYGELTEDENKAIEDLHPINLAKLSDMHELEEDLGRAIMEFNSKGKTSTIARSSPAHLVEWGLARSTPFGTQNRYWGLGKVYEDESRLRVIMDEPLALYTAIQYFKEH